MQKQPLPKASRHFPAIFIKRGILIASIAFASLLPLTSCSSSKDASRDDKMGNSELMAKKPESKGAETSPLKNVYSKADSSQEKITLSPRARELAAQRLKEVEGEHYKWNDKLSISRKFRPISDEKIYEALKMSDFSGVEEKLYLMALNGGVYSEIEKCKQEILERGSLYNDSEYANKIMSEFERIVSVK